MKADWTNANPEITAALARFGRVGVPFYVIYPPGRAGEPIILPEILTEQMVLDALRKAGAAGNGARTKAGAALHARQPKPA
jgi:thiol:disulfide interchange protein